MVACRKLLRKQGINLAIKQSDALLSRVRLFHFKNICGFGIVIP
jgi:hypothetical protein